MQAIISCQGQDSLPAKVSFLFVLICHGIFYLKLARKLVFDSSIGISSGSECIPIRGIIFVDRSQPRILSPEIPIQIAAERYLWLAMVCKSDYRSRLRYRADSGSPSRLAKISLISLSEIAAKCNASPVGRSVFTENRCTTLSTFISWVSMD